jgi:hypothetical protein
MSPPQLNKSQSTKRLGRREFLSMVGMTGLALSVPGCLSQIRNTPTEITDWHDLVAIDDELDQEYVLTTDLDADTAGYHERGAGPDGEWDPIGSRISEFTGTLDGDGHVITGLTIDQSLHGPTGLFGKTNLSTIKNLGLGTASSPVDITGGNVTGGLVGRNEGDITRCHVIGDVSGGDSVGGLVGEGNSPAKISESYVAGSVSGEGTVGGLVGANADTISESCVAGEVVGESSVGGLVGSNDSSIGNIQDTYAIATVSGTTRVGGLAGASGYGDIMRSYAAGDVAGDEVVGGVVGDKTIEEGEPGELSGVYWDRTATDQSAAIGQGGSAGASVTGFGDPDETGATTAMQGERARENMSDLSFEDVWKIVTDPPGYPELSSISIDGDVPKQ